MDSNFFHDYKKNGYAISNPILSENEIISLRSEIENELQPYEDGIIIGLEKIKNKKLLKKIINIFSSNEIKNSVENIKKTLKKDIFLLPKFQIHKNYFVNLKETLGWHRDSDGELQYEYCKKILFDEKYFFSKIGIYLQENSDFGGSIDIINQSHKYFSKKTDILRKFQSIPMHIVKMIHKFFHKIYFLFPEKFFMFFLSGIKLFPNKSSAVFFDSRLTHRGSLISKEKLKSVSFISGKYHAKTPISKNKFTLYCQLGTSDAADSYFHDRLKRENNSDEFKIWLQQIDAIRSVNKDFADQINLIVNPIKKKYT